MWPVPRLHKYSIMSCECCSWKSVQLWSCSRIGDNERRREAVNKGVDGSTPLEAVTRQKLVKAQQTEKS
jgi:hypothetical protein